MSTIIGLTGGIGSGKSTVAKLFERQHDIEHCDADQIARDVVQPGTSCLMRIAEHFGQTILLDDGNLNRATLRKIIFENPNERIWLEQLTHPVINQQIRDTLASFRSPYCFLVSPLLLETQQHALCEKIIVVDVPVAQQIQRTCDRDGNDEALVKNIIAAQMAREDRLAKADYVIDNSGSIESLKEQIQSIHETLYAIFK